MLSMSIYTVGFIELALARYIMKSCQDLHDSWYRMADTAFGAAATARDDMARDEFTSAFLNKPDMTRPRDRFRPASSPFRG